MIGEEIEILYEIDSTNEFLKRNYESFHDGAIVVAIKQTAGKGRMGRTWYSPEGGLWYSVIFKPRTKINLNIYTKIFSIAVVETIEKLKVKAKIKWPNDVYYKDKKLCGILTEAVTVNNKVVAVIVGIGLNVNNEIPNELKDKAIALKDIVGKRIKITQILDDINKIAWNILVKYRNEPENITILWKKKLMQKEGDQITFKYEGSVVAGTIKKITDEALIVDVGGKEISVNSVHSLEE